MKKPEISQLCLGPQQSIREALACIDRNVVGIALVVDGERRLLGTVTDGDVRRWILAGASLDLPLSELLERKRASIYPVPVTAPQGADPALLLKIMQERSVRQVPLLNAGGQVVDLALQDELLPSTEEIPLQAVIMAGGQGSRLRPLTEDLPKPMLPVGDRPLMEIIIQQLRLAGIRRVNVTTHYKREKITDYFGDGQDFGVHMNYVEENTPLGTAGGLSLLEQSDTPLLVINGDILTRVDFRAMLAFHRKHASMLTVGVRSYEMQVPYGVLDCEGVDVRQVREKPLVSFLVNAGIYLLEPAVRRFIPGSSRFDMPDLIHRLVAEGMKVVSFPIVEYWQDIGRHTDYEKVQKDVQDWE